MTRSTSFAAIALFAYFAVPANAQTPDVVLTDGQVLLVDQNFSVGEAIAIADGRIIATGSSAEIGELAGDSTEVIGLDGRTVIPGLIDNHFHFTRAVQRWHRQARLDGIDTRREALSILAAKADAMADDEWIMVQGGWYPGQFSDAPGGFTLAELDAVAPSNPLFVQQGYSTIYANSRALRAVGLDPADGAERPAAGLATFQPPYGAFIQAIEPTSAEQLNRNLDDFIHALNRAGLTGVYSLGRGPEGETELLFERAANGELPLRIWETLMFEANDAAGADRAIAMIEDNQANQFDGRFGIFGLGEHVYLPFFDLPNRQGPWAPQIIEQYIRLAEAAARAGWHIHEHTMMDSSVSDLLTGFEQLHSRQRIDHLRWTLAHVYNISSQNIERAKALGMTLAVHGAAMHSGTRIPFRRIADSGIVFGLGTDATIVSHYQPFETLGWAVSGLDLAGNRVLDETLSREEALTAHTRSNAWLFFQERNLGTLEVGKRADLLVLDADYLSVPAEDIRHIRPLLTMVDGRIVFSEL